MPNITLKRSAVPNRIPTVESLELGEIAINTYDGRLYLKKNVDGVETIITIKAVDINAPNAGGDGNDGGSGGDGEDGVNTGGGGGSISTLKAGYGFVPNSFNGLYPVTFDIDPTRIDLSQAMNGTSFGSYAITGSNIFRGHEILSGSTLITSSINTVFNVSIIDTSINPTPTPTPTTTGPTPTPTLTPTPTPTATIPGSTLAPTRTPDPTATPITVVYDDVYFKSGGGCGNNGVIRRVIIKLKDPLGKDLNAVSDVTVKLSFNYDVTNFGQFSTSVYSQQVIVKKGFSTAYHEYQSYEVIDCGGGDCSGACLESRSFREGVRI
jgi:hypothetical protein